MIKFTCQGPLLARHITGKYCMLNYQQFSIFLDLNSLPQLYKCIRRSHLSIHSEIWQHNISLQQSSL